MRKFWSAGRGGVESRWQRLAIRKGIAQFCNSAKSVIEIGPFYKPVCSGSHVKYFDVLDKPDLVKRARALGFRTESIPAIDFVSPKGDLSIVDEKFEVAVSCHCIEHQPDLIKHLQDVGDLLPPGGCYALIVPDKRYCFDYFLGETNIAEILAAHHVGQKRHAIASVIEHRALITHNRRRDHWLGRHGTIGLDECVTRIQAAMAEYSANPAEYIDVHAWQFTPASFLWNLRLLYKLGLSPFSEQRVFATPLGKHEFSAILRRS